MHTVGFDHLDSENDIQFQIENESLLEFVLPYLNGMWTDVSCT